MDIKFSKLFGEFNKQGIFIDMKNNVTIENVLATAIHEKTHSFLEYDTNLGQLEFLLQQIISSFSTPKDIKVKLNNWKNKIYDVSLHVQESVAMFWELSFLQCYDKKAYENKIQVYKIENKKYYNEYRFKDLEELMDNSFDLLQNYSEKRIEDKASNILKIAKRAMNVPLNELIINNNEENSIVNQIELYDASYRFFRVIDHIKEKKITLETLTEKDIDSLFQAVCLPITDKFDIEKFTTWVTNQILTPNKLQEYSSYVIYETISNPEELLFDINCYVSEDEYKYSHKRNFNKEEIARSKIYSVLYEYHVSPILSSLIDTDKCTTIISKKDYDKNIARVVKTIFTDRSSYHKLMGDYEDVLKYCLFVDFGNLDLAARRFLNEIVIEGYCIYRINDNFALVLLKGEKKITYYITMSFINLSAFKKVILTKYSKFDKWWGTNEQLKYIYAYILKISSANVCMEDLCVIDI